MSKDLEKMRNKNDTFVVQNAYNKASDEAMTYQKKTYLRKGATSLGASDEAVGVLGGMKDGAPVPGSIAETHTKGMTQRQKNIFNQNWASKSITYRQRISAHEETEMQAARVL